MRGAGSSALLQRPSTSGRPSAPRGVQPARCQQQQQGQEPWASARPLLQKLAAGAAAASLLLGAVGPAALLLPPPAAAATKLTEDESNTIQLFKRSTKSVVYITNLASRCGGRAREGRRFLFLPQECFRLLLEHSAANRRRRVWPNPLQAGRLHAQHAGDPAGRGVGVCVGQGRHGGH